MNRKRLTLIFAILVFCLPAMAVFNVQGLDRILRDVKDELRDNWQLRHAEQERLQKEYAEQHAHMLDIIKECNELSMSLYLQEKDYSFDLSNALRRVSKEYKDFSKSRRPYDKTVSNLDAEIERYARFIEALRRLPPEITTLDVVPDSLAYRNEELDTLLSQAGSSLEKEVIAIAMADSIPSIFVLGEAGQADRDTCIFYAGELLRIYAENRATILSDSLHYQEAYLRLKESYDYALTRYQELNEVVFVSGQVPLWEILSNFPYYWKEAREDAHVQYSTLAEIARIRDDSDLDEMASKSLNTYLLLVVVMLLFMVLVCALVVGGLFWLACRIIKPLGRAVDHEKGPFIALILGVLTYFSIISASADIPSMNQAAHQIATFLWLLLAIDLALIVRLKPEQMKISFLLYLPSIFMALVVIVCRVSYLPNKVMNIFFPPVLLLTFFWQLASCLMRGKKVQKSDRIICWISFGITGVATGMAVCGYIFLALILLAWWYFQLAAIHTLVALAHLAGRYRDRILVPRLERDAENITMISGADRGALLFHTTWFYHLVRHVLVPVLAICSIPLCLRYSLNVFDFDEVFENLYHSPFVQLPFENGESFFHVSVETFLWVLGLFFVFRYINKAVHAIWQRGRYNAYIRKTKRRSIRANEINLSLGNSLITVGVWFLYIVVVVQLMNIPTGSLSLAIGGLSAGIGLAMKDIINNFIYGIQLMSGRLRVGDWIECEGVRGQVTDINYQSTQVETEDATTVSFLNATLFGKSFTNLTRSSSYQFLKVTVGVAYGTDIGKVRQVLEKAMEVMKTKDRYGQDVVDPRFGIYIRFGEFSDSSVDIAVKQFVLASEHIAYRDKAKEVIYNALNENGITIPFPQRDVHIIKDQL